MLLAAVFFSSCSSGADAHQGNSAKDSTATQAVLTQYYNSLTPGKILDSIVTKSGQRYALYLPSSYVSSKAYPCIYFFDAHARGKMPVKLYKDIAEKYGFILIASDDSKNGLDMPTTDEIFTAIFNDTRSRINIDGKRIYTAGFSGGARVATAIAIQHHEIAGVVGCAAGFPNTQGQFDNKFDYVAIDGNYDFNLSEMDALDAALSQNGFTHQLLTFDGIHSWAQPAEFQTALLWLQVNAMKENRQPKNDTIINALKSDYDKRLTQATKNKDLINAHRLLAGAIAALDGLSDVTALQSRLSALNNSPDYKNELTLQQQLSQQEQTIQQALGQQFATQDEKWWLSKITELKQKSADKKSFQEARMNRRLLSFVGYLAYTYSNHALQTGDMAKAAQCLNIFKQADPQNPDQRYLTAIYCMQRNDIGGAIKSLNEAVALGYNDMGQITTEPAFASLHGNPQFQQVLEKINK